MTGPLRSGSRIAQLDQGWDEDIHVRGEGEEFSSIAAAQARAQEIAESSGQDAVILRRNGRDDHFVVYATDEIRNLDGPNPISGMRIHDLEPPSGHSIVSFQVSRHDDHTRTATVEGASGTRLNWARDQLTNAGIPRATVDHIQHDGMSSADLDRMIGILERRLEGRISSFEDMRVRGMLSVLQSAQLNMPSEGTMPFNVLVYDHLSSDLQNRLSGGA